MNFWAEVDMEALVFPVLLGFCFLFWLGGEEIKRWT